ncbi:MAG TPA: hypothetical protein VIJ93_12465, partial [bacterium]
STGNYFIKVKATQPTQVSQQMTQTIKVINNGQTGVTSVVLAPNPVSLVLNSQAQFIVSGLAGQVTGTQVKIYTIAGELVQTLSNDPGNPGLVTWTFGSDLSSGTYIAVVEIQSTGGILGRKILKAQIVR